MPNYQLKDLILQLFKKNYITFRNSFSMPYE